MSERKTEMDEWRAAILPSQWREFERTCADIVRQARKQARGPEHHGDVCPFCEARDGPHTLAHEGKP